MRGLLTTQSQNSYREQIQKEMMTRLAWKSRYAKLYPSSCTPGDSSTESTRLQPLPAKPQAALPPVVGKRNDLPPPPPPPSPPQPSPPVLPVEGEQQLRAPPLMRPVSPQTRRALYQDSHNGKGRNLYLRKRGHIRPEEKFDFPLLSSWEYGWRLGDYTLDYRTPSSARSSVVKSTFYARNGVFSSPSATDTLG